jgi:hypothetical protein
MTHQFQSNTTHEAVQLLYRSADSLDPFRPRSTIW